MKKLLCLAKASAKAIAAAVAGAVIALAPKAGVHLSVGAQALIAAAVAGFIVWITKNTKC